MKHIFFAVFVLFSQAALADNFYCEIRNGFNYKTEVAEYRVRKASVEMRPFKCQGEILKNGETVVVITSTETGDFKSAISKHPGASVEMVGLDIHGDGQDTGVCTCGLQ